MLRHMLAAKRKVVSREEAHGVDFECVDVDSNPQSESECASSGCPGNTHMKPWADFTRRAARMTEEHLQAAHVDSWVCQQRRRKWRWAYRVANMDSDRWASQAMSWDPALTSHTARRSTGRPKRRWDDDIREYINQQNIGISWERCATQRDMWSALEEGFVSQ